MSYKTGKCWSCHKKRPVEGHHCYPLEYGFPDDQELVDLCADCHNIAHREATSWYKFGKFQELDHMIPFEKGGTGERIRQLIAKIVKARQAFDSGLTQVSEQRRITQISWDSDEEHAIAHEVKRLMNFKSLERAIKTLVFEKYNQLR